MRGKSMRTAQRSQGWFMVLLVLAGIGCNGDQLNISSKSNDSERLRDRMRQVLLAAAANPEASLRCNALESLALLRPDTDVQKLVLQSLQDELPAVRFAAVVALGDMKYTPARRPLEQLLWDQEESVKMAAGYAMEKLGDTRFKKWYDAALFGRNP